MERALRWAFFTLLVRPLVLLVIGLNVRGRQHLPGDGPAILVANHNSHLDTLVMMTLLPTRLLPQLRPVAAADYFMRNRALAWFATRIIGILPLDRQARGTRDPLAGLVDALDRGDILILFPEGSRGEPERLQAFKKGVAHLVARRPQVPVVPLFLHGLGKSLPRGEALLVPFFCDVFVGEPVVWQGSREDFMRRLDDDVHTLAAQGQFPTWE
ncbi:MAG: 1-acyl-sn-glycerol-3-phosphate acyltransferase [Gammaproteobacteria bacterium]|nr:1-acyl-sn-glycerol-3-phosphate acyltransferase [Gammaproteobacteria bacterium]